eukprot:8082199-Pyramimonas_sp.AAC.1
MTEHLGHVAVHLVDACRLEGRYGVPRGLRGQRRKPQLCHAPVDGLHLAGIVLRKGVPWSDLVSIK